MSKSSFTLRIDESLLAKLKAAAEADGRSVGNLVSKILLEWTKKQKGEKNV